MEDDDNPKNVSEVERVKWLISRIDLYHKTSLESIDNAQAIFQNAGAEASNNIKAWRRGIFSILGTILAATFGISTFHPLDDWIFFTVLSLLSVGTVLNYLICGWLQSFMDNGFGLIFSITNQSKNRISESQTYVITQFADLGFLDVKTIKNYGIFALLLNIAILVNMVNELKKQKSYKTLWIKQVLKEDFKTMLESAKDVPDMYARFDNTQQFPKLGFDLIEKTLKKYSEKKKRD